MKLIDAQVAKALGWTKKQGRTVAGQTSHYWTHPGIGRGQTQKYPPCYTTSLDAIVGEIEARRLSWSHDLIQMGSSFRPSRRQHEVTVWIFGKAGLGMGIAQAKTAPLALCAALLAYLKEQRP